MATEIQQPESQEAPTLDSGECLDCLEERLTSATYDIVYVAHLLATTLDERVNELLRGKDPLAPPLDHERIPYISTAIFDRMLAHEIDRFYDQARTRRLKIAEHHAEAALIHESHTPTEVTRTH